MRHVSEEKLQEALDYYRENAFGYGSVEEYVEMDFWYIKDQTERQFIVNYIRENI
jgi:hypothetical protein